MPEFAMLQGVLLAAAVLLLVAAALQDLAVRIIPDWAPIGLAVLGSVLHLADGTILLALLVALLVLVTAAACWRCGWLGGGDVKLLAACTLLVPLAAVPDLLVGTMLIGGLLACSHLVLGRLLMAHPDFASRPQSLLPARIWRAECWRIRHHGSLPYGCAIVGAACFVLFAG